jgi:predicted Ser/Thr protein kinase
MRAVERCMSTGCIRTETLCDFLEGRANLDARARIEQHASQCNACRDILSSLASSDTLSAAPSEPATDAARAFAPGMQVGRYVVIQEIGAGAMGAVHAAFDPDLERRVALKVIRNQAAGPAARDRLLREARAMARLTHANVVTVHEVGTAGDRDFVAMELIDGETLAEWLRAGRRAPSAILDAFLAAGRGLAAAHAAGIVHRDFKPHNVLRSHGGRIAVTDFGLARQAQRAIPGSPGPGLPAEPHTTAPLVGHDSLGEFTVTGPGVGTPAYMAPEQWNGNPVTPMTDQFAYCVALWEALAGERPYRGDLATLVARGPAALDASQVPRRVRGLLRRGLDPDPTQRWPSMDALLAELAHANRRPVVPLLVAGGAIIAAAAGTVALAVAREGLDSTCEPPARDVSMVWSEAIAAELRAKTSSAHETMLATAYRDWQSARVAACAAPPRVPHEQQSCLDGVLERFDVVRRTFVRVPGTVSELLQEELTDPAICHKSTPMDVPRLPLVPTPDVLAAYELYARTETAAKPTGAEITAFIRNVQTGRARSPG